MSQLFNTTQLKIPSARLGSKQQQRESIQTQKFISNNINAIHEINKKDTNAGKKQKNRLNFQNQQQGTENQKKTDFKETISRLPSIKLFLTLFILDMFRRTQPSTSLNLVTKNNENPTPLFRNQHSYNNLNDLSEFEIQNHLQIDLSEQVAVAPQINFNESSKLYSTESINLKNINLANIDNIDISYLSSFMCLEHEVTDEDIPWSWDYLYTSVVDELREEIYDETEENDNLSPYLSQSIYSQR